MHETAEDIEHRVIEEELELQLNLLQEEHRLANQEVELFPQEMITDLPQLLEHATAEHKEPITEKLRHEAEHVIHEAEHQLIVQEYTMGEANLETFAMCLAVAGVIMLPQLLN